MMVVIQSIWITWREYFKLIIKVARELGETMTAEELAEMLERAASNGRDISREDFYNIMVKKAFWKE